MGRNCYGYLGAVAVVFASIAPAWAQSEAVVRGRVVAAADGSVLPGAEVTLRSSATGDSLEATTDAAGRFVLPRVAPGDYVMAASLDRFAPYETLLTVEPREVRNVTLPLEVGRLDVRVNVTPERRAGPGTHSPSSTLLAEHRLDALPVLHRQGLPEAVVISSPGMVRGHDDFVHVRGHEIALNPLIDGIAFWENPHAVFSAGVSPEVIETANVMTGGFPAEYGNRFGGVVDIVTRSGLRMTHLGSVSVSGGEAGRRRLAGDIGGRRGAFGFYLFGSGFESGRFLSPPEPRAIHDTARGGNAFLRVDRDLGNRGTVRALVMADGINAEIPRTALDVALRPLGEAHQRMRQQTAIVGWNRAFSNVVLAASGYERWSRLRLLPGEGPLTAKAQLERELATAGGKADLTRATGRHTLKAGLDVVWLRPEENLQYDYGGYRDLTHVLGLPHIHVVDQRIAFSGRRTGNQVSVFVQDSIQLGTRTTVDGGARVDRHDLVTEATHVSPRVNVAVRTGEAVLHASYNHFFVPPAIEGVLSSSAGLTRSIREVNAALPPLAATVEDQLEAGASLPWRTLQFAVAGYYRTTDNPVHTTVWPDSRIYSYASFDRARAYGLEAKAEAAGLARYGVTGYLNYALGRVHFYNPVTGGFITEAAHLSDTSRFLAPMDQTHTLTAGATYRHASGLWAGTTMEYGSGTPVGHAAADEHGEGEADHAHGSGDGLVSRVPGHFTGNVSLGVDFLTSPGRRPRLTLRLDVDNVTNRVHAIARESQFSPAQYSIPRLVSLTARVRF